MHKKNTILFIPAGGFTSAGKLPEFVKLRLDAAIKVFNDIKERENFIFLVSGRETPYKKPVLDQNGFPLIEAYAMAQYLVKNGIDRKLIKIEKLSLDTLGGVYFSKIFFVNYLGVKNILVFTSSFHLKRTKLYFKWIYHLKPFSKSYLINFIETPNTGLSRASLLARNKKEQQTIKIIKNLAKKLKTKKQFNNWLFTEHAGYTFGLKMFDINKDIRKTY